MPTEATLPRVACHALFLLGCGSRDAVSDATALADAAWLEDAADAARPPVAPPGLQHWLVGNPADVVTSPTGGIILMGGGTDVDAAFAWQRDRIGGGDVVVLRASGADGYNSYLFDEIGGVDSVETLVVDTTALAAEPYVRWTLDHAEAIFLAGGDQFVYLTAWKNTAVEDALQAAWQRSAVIGGTSAGCAVLGSIVYSAAQGSVYSNEALADPFNAYMTFERDFLSLPPLAGVVTDTHFVTRDRMGRLLGFVARALTDGAAAHPLGIGIDEQTALLVDRSGLATVAGVGAIYVVNPTAAPAQCIPGTALRWDDVPVHKLRAGDTISLPAATTSVAAATISARDGQLVPQNPY